MELADRLPRMRTPLYASVVFTLQAGWWLTSDGFGLAVHLPIVLAIVASALILRHGYRTHEWQSNRSVAWRHVAVIGAGLLATALVNLGDAPIETAKKVLCCIALAVALGFTALFTRAVLRASP